MTEQIFLRGELHCHNVYSNGRGSKRFPLDSPMTIVEQLGAAAMAGLDFFFLTNHNTLDGYKQLLEYQKDHRDSRLAKVKVFPGEEISAYLSRGRDGHILGYGIYDEIERGLSVQDTVYEIRRQGGVSCAPHPYGMVSSIFDHAVFCDMVEVMNSNNVDLGSDFRAYDLARELNLGKGLTRLVQGYDIPKTNNHQHPIWATAGSDAHISGAMGRCAVEVGVGDEDIADVDATDVVRGLKKGQIRVERAAYNSIDDFRKILHYQLSDSRKLLEDVRRNYGEKAERVGKHFIDSFESNPNSRWVNFAAKTFLNRMRNVSEKVNAYGYNDNLISGPWNSRIIESLMPLNQNKSVRKINFRDVAGELTKFYTTNPADRVNSLNEQIKKESIIA